MSEPDRTIPQRELRNQIGKVLREVHDQGKTIRVTVNGRPVADLVPVREGPRVSVPGWELLRMLRDTPVDATFAADIAGMDEVIPVADPWEPTS
jgi:prevent-host-death family protein